MPFRTPAVYEKEPVMEERPVSDADITDDRPVSSLTLEGRDNQVAALPLTGGDGVVVRSYSPSPPFLPLAVIALLVNVVFGVPAVACACLSRDRRQRGEEEEAAKLGKSAFWLSIIGIAVSIVVGIFVFVYIYVITPNIIHIDLGGIT